MLPQPLHPAVVHFPIVFVVLFPIVAIAGIVIIRRGGSVKSSWLPVGPDVGKVALHFGCDDIGSTMMEENVVSTAGALTKSKWAMSPEELQQCIREAGFDPVQ